MTPKVSVIMGIYNCASTLQEALDSLYAQTFQDFEIILCDDGSKDDTYALAEKNKQEHSNIVLLKNEVNKGLNYTLNKCLKYAKGKYIARMDGDDISLPERFEKEYQFLEKNPQYAIVSTTMKYFDESGVFRVGNVEQGEPNVPDFVKGTPFCHAPCMVLKTAYDAVSGYSDSPWLLRVEDYHLWMKMYLKGFKGFRLNEPLYMMRDDRNAVVRRNFRNRRNEAYVKYLICRNFKLPFYKYVWCLRPILIWLMPQFLYNKLHRR